MIQRTCVYGIMGQHVSNKSIKGDKQACYLGNETEEQNRYLSQFSAYFTNFYKREYLEKFFPKAEQCCHYYKLEPDYSYITPRYFKSLEQLCHQVLTTSEKWLIFVSSKQLGEMIQSLLLHLILQENRQNVELDEEGISIDPVVLITSSSKKKHRSRDKLKYGDSAAYEYIVSHAKTLNRVTISTAVLDNGINIEDSGVQHIAVLEMNQTSFLQMLGRKRVKRNDAGNYAENVYLYLWAKDIGEVKAYFNRSVLQYAKFLAELEIVNKYSEPQLQCNSPEWSNCQQFQQEYMVNGQIKPPFDSFIRAKEIRSVVELNKIWRFRMYKANPVTLERLAYDYYRMSALLERFQNYDEDKQTQEKEVYWLKYQLSWLSLDYDKTKWIDYPEHCDCQDQLKKYIEAYMSKLMPPEQIAFFKKNLLRLALTSHPPLLKGSSKVSISTANRLLGLLSYPVKIKSVQYKRKTYWQFVEVMSL